MEKNYKKMRNKQVALEKFLLRKKSFRFKYDVVGHRVFWQPSPNAEFELLNEKLIWRIVQKEHGAISMQYLMDTIASPDISVPFNPLIEWLESIDEPIDFDPIKEFCSLVHLEDDSEDELQRFICCTKKWFVGAVKALFDANYVHKQALVFQGKSGIGKTPFCMSFLPKELKHYIMYAPCLDFDSKDAKIAKTSSFMTTAKENSPDLSVR